MSSTVAVQFKRPEMVERAWAFGSRHAVALTSIGAVAMFVALGGLFLTVLHPWLMNWGSVREEQVMVLPGDVEAPSSYFTRAITIDAPPSTVWPW
jgi:hypothetical protein